MTDPVAASYAFGCLLERARWTVKSSSAQRIDGTDAVPVNSLSESSRGQCLAGIRAHVLNGQGIPRLGAMLHAAVLGNSSLAEVIGMMRHRTVMPAMQRAIDLETLDRPAVAAEVLDLPQREGFGDRAAA